MRSATRSSCTRCAGSPGTLVSSLRYAPGRWCSALRGCSVASRTACHWAWRELPEPFGGIPDPGRVVRDGNLITGGVVTAGIDFALTGVVDLAGHEASETIQFALEYAPAPPFEAGQPETAPRAVLAQLQDCNAAALTRRRAVGEAAAACLREQA